MVIRSVHIEISSNVDITISHSIFVDCKTNFKGGAIYSTANSNHLILFCSFQNCEAVSVSERGGGGAVYLTSGYTNVSKCCISHCIGYWGSDFLFHSPEEFFLDHVQSSFAKSSGHPFFLSAKSESINSFNVHYLNISSSYITQIQDHYSSGLIFYLFKDSELNNVILSNSSSGNDKGGLICIDNANPFKVQLKNCVFVNNQGETFVSARTEHNTFEGISCSIFNNNFTAVKNKDTYIAFNRCSFDLSDEFLLGVETVSCSLTQIANFDLIFVECPLEHVSSSHGVILRSNKIGYFLFTLINTLSKQ